MTAKYWLSPLGDVDDFGEPYDLNVGGVMYDAVTWQGPWANMAQTSFNRHGVQVGLGFGQKYELQADGKWLKVAG